MSSNIQTQHTCEHCGTAFTARTFFTRYCSKRCNNAHYKVLHRNHREQVDPPPKRSIGATGEMPEMSIRIITKYPRHACCCTSAVVRFTGRLPYGNLAIRIAWKRRSTWRSRISNHFHLNLAAFEDFIAVREIS